MRLWVLPAADFFFIKKNKIYRLTYVMTKVIIKTVKKGLNNMGASTGKENQMDVTNVEFEAVIKLIIQVIKDTEDKEELIKKIEALLK